MVQFDFRQFQDEINLVLKAKLGASNNCDRNKSIHEKLVRVRKPRVHITYEVDDSKPNDKNGDDMESPISRSDQEEKEVIAMYLEGTEIPLDPITSALTDSTIKKYLCPILKSGAGDAFELSKIITPILVSLNLAGTISISLTPLILAGIIIVITRMGVAGFCADCPESDK